jgi:peptidoglycan/xylan/chitin deacetylase (PgdA/CDA1 family)
VVERVTVHGLAGPAGTPLDAWLSRGDHLLGRLRPLVGPFPGIVVEVRGPAQLLERARAGLGDGPASAEAAAVRLRRAGVALVGGPPVRRVDERGLAELCRACGRDAVRVLRRDPSLLPEVRAGSWWIGGWRARLARRAGLAARVTTSRLPPRLLADLAFWSGVREAASGAEWRRLAGSSYVALCYHRLAGVAKPGQERMDVAPRAFERQLTLLRLLGWRGLSAEELVAFHTGPDVALPRRRYLLTADDGFAETVDELTGHAEHRPQVFAVTSSVGTRASWLADEPLAGWDELRRLHAAGGAVGSHARRHVPLDTLPDDEIEAQVAGSLDDLRARLPAAVPLLAYPHGRHDERVRAAARRAGYAAAFTTSQGRNGAGTDRWCLRRVEPKIWDTTLSFAWKVVTGESPPPYWERRLERRWARRRDTAGARGAG